MKAMASISNWAWLPRDLLDAIMDKLVPISDCIRFSIVCKSWRSAAVENFRLRGLKNKRHADLHRQQLPLLMTPTEENSREIRGLYSVTAGRTYQHQLHVPYTKRCCGSSHGWLLAIDETMVLSLLNPFSGAVIRLPAILGFHKDIVLEQEQEEAFNHIEVDTDFQEYDQSDKIVEDEDGGDDEDEDEDEDAEDDEEDDEEEDDGDNIYGNEEHDEGFDDNVEDDEDDFSSGDELNLNHEYTIHKAVLSKDPDLYPDDYAVMIIYGHMRRLAFFKSGDKHWTYLHPKLQVCSDIIYSQGKFLCLRHWGDIWSCDINSSPPKVEKIARPLGHFSRMMESYLVELPKEDELVYVHKILDGNLRACGFKAMRRQIEQEQSKWVKTSDLGGATLFLGGNYSTSVLASDYPGCQPDCIYFTDDFVDFFVGGTPYEFENCDGGGPCDNGFYNLKDGSFGKHYALGPSQVHMPPPIWLIPKFK